MKDIYVDSEVIADFLLDNKPFSDSAAGLFSLAESNCISIHISACTFSNLYKQLIHGNNAPHLTGILQKLSYLVNIVEVNTKVIQLALSSKFTNFEYALEYFTALQSPRVSVFISRTFNATQQHGLLIMTPENYLNCIQRYVSNESNVEIL